MKFLKNVFALDPQFLYFLLVITTIIYTFSWGGGFLSDDIAGIQYNPNMGNLTLQLKTLNINNIFNSLSVNIFGTKAVWFHISNTIFHLFGVIAVYIFVYLLSKNIWITRLTTLLFAIHPIEIEGVAWISGLSYITYSFLFVFSLIYYLLAFRIKNNADRYKNYFFANLFLILSLSSSEKAVVFPGVLIVMLVFFIRPITKAVLFGIIPAFAISGIYTLSRISDISTRTGYINPNHTGEPVTFNPVIQVPIAIYSYIKLMLIPINMTLYHEFNRFPSWEYKLAIIVTVITLTLIIVCTYYALKKKDFLFSLIPFGLIFFISSLALTLLPINIAWVVAERYVHLGTIGFFITLSATIYLIVDKLSLNKDSFYQWVFIILVPLLTILTIRRNLQWHSQDTLWPATVKVSPDSAYAWNNMGDYYGRHGDIQKSITAFENAIKLRPRYADATHNLANVYMQTGEATKAAKLFQQALEYNPNLYQSYTNLGRIALSLNQFEPAIEYLTKSAEMNPDPFLEYLMLFVSYSKINSNKADFALAQAIKLAKNNSQRLQLIQQIQQNP